MSRRARGLALLGAAACCAGLAASSTSRYTNEVRAQVGAPVPVVTARSRISGGSVLTPASAARYLEVRQVPERFAPTSALHAIGATIGYRIAMPLSPGDYVTDGALSGQVAPGSKDVLDGGGGARVVEISVAGATSIAEALHPGSRVDVLITTERGSAPRTYLALQGATLVDFRAGAGGEGGDGAGKAAATLRVSLRQAVLLTAAENFARELRLVPRPAGSGTLSRPTAVSASELGR